MAIDFKEQVRSLSYEYFNQHEYGSALFWASQLICVDGETTEDDQVLYAKILLHNGQFHRAAQRLQSRGLDKRSLSACHLTAKAFFSAKDSKEALKVLDGGSNLLKDAKNKLDRTKDPKEAKLLRMTISSFYLLKGQVLESIDNRGLAGDAFKEALKVDVHCSEAFTTLIQHQILSLDEEKELLASLPLVDNSIDDYVGFIYGMRTKKYARPEDLEVPEKFQAVASNLELEVQRAETEFYNCNYVNCLDMTTRVMKEDPYHVDCLPLHVSALVECSKANDLFRLAHELIDIFPEWSVSWFAVGCYYFLTGKQDLARRYLSKATQLDRVFGPAWLAYGHSFAMENEHDQAMAAYFKACQLLRGCHLPLLYIGVEYGLTNNSKLAEKYFKQALEVAPNDPFVLHELGVTTFNNADYRVSEKYFLKAYNQILRVQGTVMSAKWEPLINNLAHVSRKLGKLKEALEYHHMALVLVPLNASTYSAIGYVHSLKEERLEAVEAFHKALGIRRDDTFSTTMLGDVIADLGFEEPAFSGQAEDIPRLDLNIAPPSAQKSNVVEDVEMSDSDPSLSIS